MIVAPLVPNYQALLTLYLFAPSDLAREDALLAADRLAHQLLPARVSLDDMLALHARAKRQLAEAWRDAPVGSDEHRGLQRLANGDAIPLMLALMLPQQMAERQQAERRWQAEHARLSAVFEQTDDLVVLLAADGRIDYLNPAFTRSTGWTLAEAQARPGAVWQAALPAEGTAYAEAEQPRADGSVFPASWSISAIVDADGALLNHVCIGRDVTRQRQVDDALRQNDRLRAVATLAAGVAHDFNNLLGSIQGLTEICQALSAPGSTVARNLDGIHRASLRAAELVGQLLSFARERPANRQALDVGPWLRGLQPLLAAALPKNVALRLALDEGLRVDGDAAQLEQVLLNLVKNAGHASRARGGEVLLRAEAWQDPATGGDGVRLQVVDHGEGIAPEVLPRIFEPFFTTKPVDEGTGLGLAAAYGIVRQHQGRLLADSTPGGPTVFSVLLPRPPSAARAPADAAAGAAPALASWYEVDMDDRIAAVSPDWDAAAGANGGAACTAAQVVGKRLAELVAGEGVQRDLRALIGAVRLTEAAQTTVYRCDSPTELRTVEMVLQPGGPGRVRLSHRLLASQPRVPARG